MFATNFVDFLDAKLARDSNFHQRSYESKHAITSLSCSLIGFNDDCYVLLLLLLGFFRNKIICIYIDHTCIVSLPCSSFLGSFVNFTILQ